MDQENKIRKVLFNEVAVVMTVVAVLSSIILTYADLRMKIQEIDQKVDTMQTNELVHLKDSISAIESRNAVADSRQTNMEKQITMILTILGKQ